jgi:phage virion morphogenesis protein
MKASGRENDAVVEFTGKVQRLAHVHQYGLPNKVSLHDVIVQYARETLLGFNTDNKNCIKNLILDKILFEPKR